MASKNKVKLIFGLICLLLVAIYFSRFFPSHIRPDPYLLCKTNLRYVKHALMSYFMDNHAFPPSDIGNMHPLHRLTTPVPYIPASGSASFTDNYNVSINKKNIDKKLLRLKRSSLSDPQTVPNKRKLKYYSSDKAKAYLWSVGGNAISDVSINDGNIMLNKWIRYHPTNGIFSKGDIWLFIQTYRDNNGTIDFKVETSYKSLEE